MGEVCTHRRDEKCILNFRRKVRRKETTWGGGTRNRWEGNIKT